ncbi:ATP-binding protein [Mycolicibacterium smegmatis]|uniref:ATP-binding protein n=1 Tax=Mycolicibacterium smegmatis TaxID=1772 RepID=UPI001E596FE5|nr:ATP-binding protein [Mycolicibacterium smegmatis]UGU30614.1 ATP-binding protein [Mycolicibacterium smegmatis]ULN71531.1 ATP-binding protein [Mycolicibacterium smegmatis]
MDDIATIHIDSVNHIHVPPTDGLLKALGLEQSFEAAVADLIDNSLDAKATRVLVRFILRKERAAQLIIVDNGRGMDHAQINEAMQLGRRRGKQTASHGFYGVGLKASTFGQASTLTVLSRGYGNESEGRRMHREAGPGDFEVDVLNPETVGVVLQGLLQFVGSSKQGTVVQWDGVKDFPGSRDPAQTNTYLDNKVSALNRHLGMVYHRLLERREVEISIDVYDADAAVAGPPTSVDPIDPFGYHRTGDPAYPKELVAEVGHMKVALQCHIWPPRSDAPQYRLYGKPVEDYQGLYLYRKDRLLKAGGWGGVVQDQKSFKLARVAVDIDKHLDVFDMSVSKEGVRLKSSLVAAIEQASSRDGTTFEDYLEAATDAVKRGNTRQRKRVKILPPGQGLDPVVKRAIKREAPLLEGEEAIRIRWKNMRGSNFVVMDRKARTLWLNEKYRQTVLHGDRGNVNDAPLLKALLYLLFEDLFRGQAMGPKDKENERFWNRVLMAAAEAEAKYQ